MKALAADFSHGLMRLLVALFGAAVTVFMRGSAMPLPAFFLLAAALFALLFLLSRKFGHMGFDLPASPDSFSLRIFFAAAVFAFAVLMIYLIAYYPGGFSSDNVYQWRQIQGNAAFSDWHPALHTIFLWALTRIAHSLSFVVAVQALCYALAAGYVTATLARWRVPKVLYVLTALYLGANPGLSNLLIFPWKDCVFAICALTLVGQLFSLYASHGAWLKKKRNLLALGVMLCLCAIMRHNGIALVLPINSVPAKAAAASELSAGEGLALHCWNWSYKSIEENMAMIARMGYTSVQTSPIQQAKQGTAGARFHDWWVYYQPAAFSIDNSGKSGVRRLQEAQRRRQD